VIIFYFDFLCLTNLEEILDLILCKALAKGVFLCYNSLKNEAILAAP
jgi:hypothetical protein